MSLWGSEIDPGLITRFTQLSGIKSTRWFQSCQVYLPNDPQFTTTGSMFAVSRLVSIPAMAWFISVFTVARSFFDIDSLLRSRTVGIAGECPEGLALVWAFISVYGHCGRLVAMMTWVFSTNVPTG